MWPWNDARVIPLKRPGWSISEVLGLVCWWLENDFACQTDEFQKNEKIVRYNQKIHKHPWTLMVLYAFVITSFLPDSQSASWSGWPCQNPLQLVFMMLATGAFGAHEQQLNLLTIIVVRSTTCIQHLAVPNATIFLFQVGKWKYLDSESICGVTSHQTPDSSAATFSHCCCLAGGSRPRLPKNLRQRVKKEKAVPMYSQVCKSMHIWSISKKS